jgi:diaminopimelate epimerase
VKFPFTKMHGQGNDFVVFDFTENSFALTKDLASRISDRNFGVGCDQILIVERSPRSEIDFKYRIINADGSEVGQCGNGARCIAAFVYQQGLSRKSAIKVETMTGEMDLHHNASTGFVTVNMGIPNFDPPAIPLDADILQDEYQLTIESKAVAFSALSIGNPHAVMRVADVDTAPIETLGPCLESHPIFPERANISFMQIINRDTVKLRVFERGVGETIACGSGACAAVVSGISLGQLNDTVCVKLPGGNLEIDWKGDGEPVMMSGPTATVFSGILEI